MLPKEKAQELFDKMCQTISSGCEHDSYCSRKECTWKGMTFCVVSQNEAKQCALIAIDEIEATETLSDRQCGYLSIEKQHKEYWKSVKAEIEKL